MYYCVLVNIEGLTFCLSNFIGFLEDAFSLNLSQNLHLSNFLLVLISIFG